MKIKNLQLNWKNIACTLVTTIMLATPLVAKGDGEILKLSMPWEMDSEDSNKYSRIVYQLKANDEFDESYDGDYRKILKYLRDNEKMEMFDILDEYMESIATSDMTESDLLFKNHLLLEVPDTNDKYSILTKSGEKEERMRAFKQLLVLYATFIPATLGLVKHGEKEKKKVKSK